ncbi:hypothetical protein B0H14DRAFT_2582864 [Mycena olivaceomarginata]|nr:hypothetical protein B0H14DRAFT_2582864 [Mycena olivaceomarginata]
MSDERPPFKFSPNDVEALEEIIMQYEDGDCDRNSVITALLTGIVSICVAQKLTPDSDLIIPGKGWNGKFSEYIRSPTRCLGVFPMTIQATKKLEDRDGSESDGYETMEEESDGDWNDSEDDSNTSVQASSRSLTPARNKTSLCFPFLIHLLQGGAVKELQRVFGLVAYMNDDREN